MPERDFLHWEGIVLPLSEPEQPVNMLFALDDTRPLFFFAGIWRPVFGERKGEAGEHLVFAFLTTEPNAEVTPREKQDG